LRPGGVVIDCHPVGRSVRLEIEGPSRTLPLGELSYSEEFVGVLANADRAWSQLYDDEIFLQESVSEYRVKVRLDSLERWEQYWEEEAAYYVPLSETQLHTLREELARPGAELIFDIPVRAARFRRPTPA
jgi:hypothetical protein